MYSVKTDDMFHAILAALKRTITKFILSFLGCIWFVCIVYILDLSSLTVKTQGAYMIRNKYTEINQIHPKCLSKSKSMFSVCITTDEHLKELMGMLKTKWNGKVYYKKLLEETL